MDDERRSDEWLEANRPNTSAPSPARETVRPTARDTTRPASAAQPQARPGRHSGTPETNHPMVLSILYLISFVIGFTGLIAFVLALVWRAEPGEEWERSHYDYHVRTFLIWLGAFVAGLFLVLTIVGFFLGILLWFAAWIQVLLRAIISLARAQAREPMPNPRTLLA